MIYKHVGFQDGLMMATWAQLSLTLLLAKVVMKFVNSKYLKIELGTDEKCPAEIFVDAKKKIPGDIDYSGKYTIFHEQSNKKPVYRHEMLEFYIYEAEGWKLGQKAANGSENAEELLTSNEKVACPLDVKDWTSSAGKPVNYIHVYAESDINHIIHNRGSLFNNVFDLNNFYVGRCEKEVGYTGEVIETIYNVNTVKGCDIECQFDARCSAFSIDAATYTCYLYQNYDQKKTKELYVSGLEGCTKASGIHFSLNTLKKIGLINREYWEQLSNA